MSGAAGGVTRWGFLRRSHERPPGVVVSVGVMAGAAEMWWGGFSWRDGRCGQAEKRRGQTGPKQGRAGAGESRADVEQKRAEAG